MTVETIKIRPTSNNHGLFLILTGSLFFLITLIVSQWYWHQFRLVFIALFMIFSVVIFTGILKKHQPEFSIKLTKNKFMFIHQYGSWEMPWEEIAYISPVSSVSGVQRDDLPYVGVRLKNVQVLENKIEHRLANKLIHEQRPLLIWALSHELISLEQSLINFDTYSGLNGTIKGPQAAFLHQTNELKQAFGFHLFIHKSALDRELSEFCQLVNTCQRYSLKRSD